MDLVMAGWTLFWIVAPLAAGFRAIVVAGRWIEQRNAGVGLEHDREYIADMDRGLQWQMLKARRSPRPL